MAEQTKKALIVEDDGEQLETLKKSLGRDFGMDVHEAKNMADARILLLSAAEAYDLFIIDVILPHTASDAAEVEKLEKKRMQILLRENGGSAAKGRIPPKSTDEVRRRYEVQALDENIAQHQDQEGGVKLIREYRSKLPQGRNSEAPCPIPTLFLTARMLPLLEKQALGLIENGKGRWLVKPQRWNEIRNAITAIMDGSRTP
jgi:DNA-binding response OmpR family regulator